MSIPGYSRASFLARTRLFALGLAGAPIAAAHAAVTSGNELLKGGFAAFKGKSLEQKVQELADREEIRELAARYAQRISRRQSPSDLFTDDGAFLVQLPGSPLQEARGREQLDKTFNAIIARPEPSLPKIHNHVISVSGNDAFGLCWIEVKTKGQDGGGSGYYEDTLRREQGRWKFVTRAASMVEWQAPSQMPANAAEMFKK